jgi:hypothetical protein
MSKLPSSSLHVTTNHGVVTLHKPMMITFSLVNNHQRTDIHHPTRNVVKKKNVHNPAATLSASITPPLLPPSSFFQIDIDIFVPSLTLLGFNMLYKLSLKKKKKTKGQVTRYDMYVINCFKIMTCCRVSTR